MKKLIAIILFTLSIGSSYAQIGIGTAAPDASAALDVSASNKGFLLPRVANVGAIATPVAGLIIYDVSEQCIKYYNGTDWSGCLLGDSGTACGAYVDVGVYKAFMCHNLGADTNLDPDVPVQGIHGNYYQWGRSTVVADAYTSAGVIGGWNTTSAANGSWSDTSKTANDPCPAGFRVPTNSQWAGVIANNTVSRTGSWANSATNFTTAIHWGPDVSTKTLTLPAAGYRNNTDGTLYSRGSNGHCWSSSGNGALAGNLYFFGSSVSASNGNRAYGFSVRCVSE